MARDPVLTSLNGSPPELNHVTYIGSDILVITIKNIDPVMGQTTTTAFFPKIEIIV